MKSLCLSCLLVLSLMLSACSIVGPQERGIRIWMGSAGAVQEPGPHIWFPVIIGMAKVDVSIQKSEVETAAASKDMQEIKTLVAINWSLQPDKVSEIYKTLGDEDDALRRVLVPSVNEVLKAATAKLTAEQILSQRILLKQEIDNMLKARMAQYGLVIHDVNIMNLRFTDEFEKAIEHKQVAEQESLQAHFVAQKAEQMATARVNQARGEAEAQRMLQTSLSPTMIQLKAVEKWDGKFPTVMGQGGLPFINLSK